MAADYTDINPLGLTEYITISAPIPQLWQKRNILG